MRGIAMAHDANTAGLVAAGVALVSLIGAGIEWVRRRVVSVGRSWRSTAVALEQEIRDQDSAHAAALIAFREDMDHRIAAHEQRASQDIALLKTEVAGVRDSMARREDLGRVEGKLDQLLLQRGRQSRD